LLMYLFFRCAELGEMIASLWYWRGFA